jgi:hypothetical protein
MLHFRSLALGAAMLVALAAGASAQSVTDTTKPAAPAPAPNAGEVRRDVRELRADRRERVQDRRELRRDRRDVRQEHREVRHDLARGDTAAVRARFRAAAADALGADVPWPVQYERGKPRHSSRAGQR